MPGKWINANNGVIFLHAQVIYTGVMYREKKRHNNILLATAINPAFYSQVKGHPPTVCFNNY
jgi:hypothetical protein